MEIADKIIVSAAKIFAIILTCICLGLIIKFGNDEPKEK